jgi:cellulose synthase/poly-beta-1,6-N-acetylglucosamine synthase-like glycosyltransferase
LPLLVELFVLTLASLFYVDPGTAGSLQGDPSFRLAVIVPAHNEEMLVDRCVRSLRTSDENSADVFVIAHNCTDRTGLEAEGAGARVLVLDDPNQTGKGCALRYGFSIAMEEGYDGVLVIDADSVVTSNLLRTVGHRFSSGARALQCRYGVHNPEASDRTRLMSLALQAFNVVRPRGRARLGFSTGLFGNGFGLCRDLVERFPFGADSVVEDLEYHLTLVRAGERVEFIDSASVFGEMPSGNQGAATQRSRWEGGRLRMAKEAVPQLLREMLRGRPRLIEPLMDLAALPLALEVVVLAMALCLPLAPIRAYALVGMAVIAFHVVVALRCAPDSRHSAMFLLCIPRYIAWKVTMLPRTWRASRVNAAWERTQRDSPL